jgi:mono/diheme cytochrome c family protein
MAIKSKLKANKTAKSLIETISPLTCLVVLMLSACGGPEVINGKESNLIKENVTAGGVEVVYPDAPPSVPDGKTVWQKLNCAVCHGMEGKGKSDKCPIDLADKYHMVKQKPVEQYKFLVFGKPGLNHPTVDKLISRRDAWNLVFYMRSLARPALTAKEVDDITPVFGSNCAVCHGTKGYGDGPVGRNFEPMPANFQNFSRFYDRTDYELWDHIANGIKWEGMPNFLGKEDKAKNVKFDQAYIWKLVDYVRHFHESTQSTASTGT